MSSTRPTTRRQHRPIRLRPRRRSHQRRRSTPGRWCRSAARLATLPEAAAAGAQDNPTYSPPVDAPIVDPFRPPAAPYGAGNRGLEYDTRPGEAVLASADGTVVFAGPVAGSQHVTLQHEDGVRTTYSFLSRVEVVLGQRLRRGARVGEAGERLHFGARDGDVYFDPAVLFAGGDVAEVELLPFEVAPGGTPEGEALAIALMLAGESGGPGLPGIGDALGWLYDRAGTALGHVTDMHLPVRGLGIAAELTERLLFHGPCSEGPPPAGPVRGEDRVAITVAGLGSSSAHGSIDELRTAELGYHDDSVVRFSYAGGRAPGSGAAFDHLPTTTYDSEGTQRDLHLAGDRLADLVEAVATDDSDITIDLFAHSQGGLVTRLALLELAERGFALDRLGVVTTLGSPHHGAVTATAVAGASSSLAGSLGLDAIEALLDTGIDPDATSVRQLAEGSDLVRKLAREGVPPDIRLLSIGARGDLVVPAPNTEVGGATNVTVPVTGWSAHGDLVASDAATDEMARALAGRPPACEGWRDVVADVAVGEGISLVEDGMGALAQSYPH